MKKSVKIVIFSFLLITTLVIVYQIYASIINYKYVVITFNGATEQVSGSCTHFKTDKLEFLVDCGLFYPEGEGTKEERERRVEEESGKFEFSPEKIKFVLITHAHLDHIGRLPLLKKRGFNGPIFTTEGTKQLAKVMLNMVYRYSSLGKEDLVKSEQRKVVHTHPKCEGAKKIRDPKVYNMTRKEAIDKGWRICKICADIETNEIIEQFRTYSYQKIFSPIGGINVEFYDAGHIPGAASILIQMPLKSGSKTFLFSGDLGNNLSRITSEPIPPSTADYLFIESTYGSFVRTIDSVPYEKFKKDVGEAIKNDRIVFIPAFVLDRTQKILFAIYKGQKEKIIPIDVPVYVTSPSAKKINTIYNDNYKSKFRPFFRDEIYQFKESPFVPQNLNYDYIGSEDKENFNFPHPSIIISASGMLDYASSLDIAPERLKDPKTTLMFVSYQDPMSIGGRIKEFMNLEKSEKREIELDGKIFEVNCEIKSYNEFSAHADADQLFKWVRSLSGTKKVFILHGEPKDTISLKLKIEKQINKVEVIIPKKRDIIKIQ